MHIPPANRTAPRGNPACSADRIATSDLAKLRGSPRCGSIGTRGTQHICIGLHPPELPALRVNNWQAYIYTDLDEQQHMLQLDRVSSVNVEDSTVLAGLPGYT